MKITFHRPTPEGTILVSASDNILPIKIVKDFNFGYRVLLHNNTMAYSETLKGAKSVVNSLIVDILKRGIK